VGLSAIRILHGPRNFRRKRDKFVRNRADSHPPMGWIPRGVESPARNHLATTNVPGSGKHEYV
jgi:hypothetical protein